MNRFKKIVLLGMILIAPFLILACDGDDDTESAGPGPGPPPASTGVWIVSDNAALPADNVANFLGDNTYFNVHSAAFPDGEIRGQIDFIPTTVKFASLDGGQEVPPNGSTARGAGVLAFNAADNTIAGFVVTEGVTGTAAHIHAGARGVAGGVAVPLEGGPSHWFVPDNTTLPADNVANFLADNAYYNVHSAAFADGEIRGQLDRTPTSLTTTEKFASLDGAQEVPPNASTALGGGILVFESFDNTIAGFVVTEGVTGTAAHIHAGTRGVAGGIIEPLLPSP